MQGDRDDGGEEDDRPDLGDEAGEGALVDFAGEEGDGEELGAAQKGLGKGRGKLVGWGSGGGEGGIGNAGLTMMIQKMDEGMVRRLVWNVEKPSDRSVSVRYAAGGANGMYAVRPMR